MKNTLVTNIAAVLLILVPAAAHADGSAIGKVVSFKGSAESSSPRREPLHLSEGSSIFAGDKITTHADTQLRILLADKIAMQLGPDTEMTITHPAVRDTRVSLKKGSLMSSVHPLSGTERPRFAVRTPSASMGVRGTTFFVAETPSKPTFVCICHGSVNVKTKKSETPITSEHHDFPKFVDPENGTLIAAQGGVAHKDEDAAALQKLVE